MRIATWNVNSLRARLDFVLLWLALLLSNRDVNAIAFEWRAAVQEERSTLRCGRG